MLDARFGGLLATLLWDINNNLLCATVGLASLVRYEVASHKDGMNHGDLGCGQGQKEATWLDILLHTNLTKGFGISSG